MTARTLVVGLALVLLPGVGAWAQDVDRPNIVFVLADDLGWNEVGVYGSRFNETPSLDRLALEGVKFTQAYAAAPVCSPYRVSLMSGQWPARVGITDYLRPDDPKHLPRDVVTLAEALREAGYATGMIGKWHLTGYEAHGAEEVGPGEQGFDEVMVTESRGIGGGDYWHPYEFAPGVEKVLPGEEYLVDRTNAEAVRFIERHQDEPFFLYLSHYAVHTLLDGEPERVEHFAQKSEAGEGQRAERNNPHLAAQLEAIDEGVEMILERLDELGLSENTAVIFTSDNGGQSSVTDTAPLRGGKSTLYEAGIRIPLIVRYPGMTPEGKVSHTVTTSTDLYPTLLELAGAAPPADQALDGVSIVPTLRDPEAEPARDALYWYYPLDRLHFLGGRSAGAVRDGDWKMIEFFDTGDAELYNVAVDVGEQHDLAEHRPEKLAELRQRYDRWLGSLGITAPEPPEMLEANVGDRTVRFVDRGTTTMRGDAFWPRRFAGDEWLQLVGVDVPDVAERPLRISARIQADGRDGVILAHGGQVSGYSLYLDDGRPAFAVAVEGTRTSAVAGELLPGGVVELEARLEADGTMTLLVDGVEAARAAAPGLVTREPADGLEVGADANSPVGPYRAPSTFQGTIHSIILDR